MRLLTYEQVRRAGLPARVEMRHVTYDYQPAEDKVVVKIRSSPQPAAAVTYRIPLEGWRHEVHCGCRLCTS